MDSATRFAELIAEQVSRFIKSTAAKQQDTNNAKNTNNSVMVIGKSIEIKRDDDGAS